MARKNEFFSCHSRGAAYLRSNETCKKKTINTTNTKQMPYISLSSLAWGMTANGTADAVVLIVLIVFIF